MGVFSLLYGCVSKLVSKDEVYNTKAYSESGPYGGLEAVISTSEKICNNLENIFMSHVRGQGGSLIIQQSFIGEAKIRLRLWLDSLVNERIK